MEGKVKRSVVITTGTVVYDAWVPSSVFGPHSTITTIDGRWYGRVGTDRLPPEIDALPRGDDRIAAVQAWHTQREAVAYRAILRAFPELALQEHTPSMGEITTHRAERYSLEEVAQVDEIRTVEVDF